MALQFVAGGAGSGKTRLLYERAIEESMRHPDVQYLFLVPEQYTMQTQREIIRLHPRHGVMNIDILSFKRLAYRVFEDLASQIVDTQSTENLSYPSTSRYTSQALLGAINTALGKARAE